jgi:hypothetical protein
MPTSGAGPAGGAETESETMTNFIRNDGGRAASGYKGTARDCVVRAIAIATERPYDEVYDSLFELNRSRNKNPAKCSPRNAGTHRKTIHAYMDSIGWKWTPTMKIGQGCKVHLRADELPAGRLIVSLSHHLCAVIDGVIHDTHECSRDGTRCVYGYWSKA